MLPELELIVKVQGIDVRAAEFRKEIASLPKHIAVIEKTLESHQRKLDSDRALLAANQKERRQIESDVQVQHQKISKLKDQMLLAKTNEQFRAFQHEIEFCENVIRKLEDRELDLMGESETLERNVKAAEGALKAEKEQVEREKAEARERTAADQRQLDTLMSERAETALLIPAASYALYEKCAKKFGGLVVSDATDGRCAACQVDLRPQLFQDLRKGESIILCENCKRILHYNPPVAFDAELGGNVPAGHGTRVDMS